MKKGLLLLFITISGLCFSCKKDRKESAPVEIYGKWKLTETMNDPGDGSGKYIKATGEPKYLSFDKDGKLGGDALYMDVFRYRIIDSTRIEILYQNYIAPQVYWYKLTAKTLQINPPCIEGCGLRFVRN